MSLDGMVREVSGEAELISCSFNPWVVIVDFHFGSDKIKKIQPRIELIYCLFRAERNDSLRR